MKLNCVSKTKLFVTAIAALFFASCKKSIESSITPASPVNIVNVKEGHLAFRNFSDFSEFRKMVESSPSSERREIERDLGFKSLFTQYEDLVKKIESSQTFNEINKLLENTNPYFEYSERGLMFKRQNEGFAKILGVDGIIEIGTIFYKSIDEGRVIATSNNVSLLKSINSVEDYLNYGNDDIKIDRFASKIEFANFKNHIHTRSDAGPYVGGTNKYYIISAKNESNNRRLYIDLVNYHEYWPKYGSYPGDPNQNYSGFTYRYKNTLTFTHRKKSTLGIWNYYVSPTYINEIRLGSIFSTGGTVIFSGTLNNNSWAQEYLDTPLFGSWSPLVSYSNLAAPSFIEHTYNTPTRIVATGNGQNMYTNTNY